MVVNDRRISQIMAAQPIRVIRCIFRCIREMLVCIDESTLKSQDMSRTKAQPLPSHQGEGQGWGL